MLGTPEPMANLGKMPTGCSCTCATLRYNSAHLCIIRVTPDTPHDKSKWNVELLCQIEWNTELLCNTCEAAKPDYAGPCGKGLTSHHLSGSESGYYDQENNITLLSPLCLCMDHHNTLFQTCHQQVKNPSNVSSAQKVT